MEIGYCPKCNVPLRGDRCDICKSRGIPLRFHDLGDIRPASKREMEILTKLIPFRELRGYIKNRLVLLSRQPGLDYRKDIFVDGYKFGTLEYVKDEKWRWKFIPSGKAAKFIYDFIGHVDFEIESKKHAKGKKINREVNGDWAIVSISGCIGVATKAKEGARIKDVFCRKVKAKKRGNLENAVISNTSFLKIIEKKAVEFIKRKNPRYVSFSGGKDSGATLYLSKMAGVKKAVFFNTGLEFPETERFVRQFADMLDVELIELEPKHDFWEVVEKLGIPTKDNRWCTSLLKLENLENLSGAIVDGTRRYESFARMVKGREKIIGNVRVIHPIIDWLSLDVWMFLKWKGLPYNPLYDMGYERIGCFMCPAMLNAEFHNLKRTHPELFKRWYDFLQDSGFTHKEIMDGTWRWKNIPAKMKI